MLSVINSWGRIRVYCNLVAARAWTLQHVAFSTGNRRKRWCFAASRSVLFQCFVQIRSLHLIGTGSCDRCLCQTAPRQFVAAISSALHSMRGLLVTFPPGERPLRAFSRTHSGRLGGSRCGGALARVGACLIRLPARDRQGRVYRHCHCWCCNGCLREKPAMGAVLGHHDLGATTSGVA